MEIEILRSEPKKWQSQCAPIQRSMTAKKGGMIVILKARKGKEASFLNAFHTQFLKIREKTTKGRMFGNCLWEEIYSEFSDDASETYLIVIQIHNGKCLSDFYFAVSELLNIYGRCRESLGD